MPALHRARRRFAVALLAGFAAAMLVTAPHGARAQPPASAPKDVRFVVFHLPGPAWLPGKTLFDQPGVREHVAHYRRWLEAGKLELGGPHLDSAGGGMMIPVAGVGEAEVSRFASEDPAVRSGVLVAVVRPWLIGMAK